MPENNTNLPGDVRAELLRRADNIDAVSAYITKSIDTLDAERRMSEAVYVVWHNLLSHRTWLHETAGALRRLAEQSDENVT